MCDRSSLSHSTTLTHSVGLLWTCNQPVAETSTWQHTTLAVDRHSCLRAGFESATPGIEPQQTHALERAATRVGTCSYPHKIFCGNHWTRSCISLDVVTRNVWFSGESKLVLILIWYTWYLTAIGLPHGGSNTVHIYNQAIHRTTQCTN
jgi:hypothetical protein